MKIAVIPARGGSKRIPRKNIRDFCGKPIIAWSIEAALQCDCFDMVIVSTDDEEIAGIATDFGAQIPFLRPAELSGDHITTSAVIRHAIEHVNSTGSKGVEYACCIYATAPFVETREILNGLATLDRTGCQYVFPITTYAFPIQRSLRVTREGKLEMFQPDKMFTRSQDLETAYHDAGQFYWGRSAAWLSDTPIFSGDSAPIMLARHKVQDIDTMEDWAQAEYMFRALNQIGTSSTT